MVNDTQQIPEGYKQTDVGAIPNSWKALQIRDVAKYRRGSFPQPYGLPQWYDEIGGKPFIQVVDVGENCRLKKTTKQKLSKKAEKYSVFVKKGSVIITIQGSIGRVAVTDYDAYMDRTLLLFESFNVPVDVHFFKYALQVLFEKEKQSAPGGIIKTITKEALSSFVLQIPPIEEQSLISNSLSDIDSLISKLDQLIQKKKNIKQGAMQELLTGKRRLPEFTGEWEDVTLEELERAGKAKLFRGKVISKKDIDNFPGSYPIYSSSIHNNGKFGQYGKHMFDEELITWSVDGGGNFFYRPKHKFSVTNVCGYIRLTTRSIRYDFLAFQLQQLHSYLSFDYTMKAHPSVIRKAYSLKLPSVKEQAAIAQILLEMGVEIDVLEAQKIKYTHLKQAMMQQLLTGKIRLI